MTRVGLISDTHNLLRPAALEFLRGAELIVHAGDVCEPKVLALLRELAPVIAVRGNNDTGTWADTLKAIERVEVEGIHLLVIHDLKQLKSADVQGCDVVVSGHSHRPLVQQRGDTLYINPGSAGPRRFSLPVSVGELLIEDRRITARLVTLDVAAQPASVKCSR